MTNKWIKAFTLDITGREDKSPLTREEKQTYTLSVGVSCAALGILNMLLWYPYCWLVSLVLFGIFARKLQIWHHKRDQLD